jgi:hypothetical protein
MHITQFASRPYKCSAGIPRGWRDTRGFFIVASLTAAGPRILRVAPRYIDRQLRGRWIQLFYPCAAFQDR